MNWSEEDYKDYLSRRQKQGKTAPKAETSINGQAAEQKRSKSKYGNSKTVVDGIEFDSQKEANRYCELKMLRMSGQIRDFECQPEFELLPPFRYNGRTVKGVKYKGDFKVIYPDGRVEIEDVKSIATARDKVYRLKIKMLLSKYGEKIVFRERL